MFREYLYDVLYSNKNVKYMIHKMLIQSISYDIVDTTTGLSTHSLLLTTR